MFFDLLLLQPQQRGRLHCAWVAATRGVTCLNKKIILQADVEAICRVLQEFICSQSDSPRERFSLRLSSILINGVVKINNRKACYVWDEVFKIMTAVTCPPPLAMPRLGHPSIREIVDTPPTPTVAKKGKKRHLKDTPETDLEGLLNFIRDLESQSESEPTTQARVDDITLRDNLVAATRPSVNVEDEFGPGLFGFEELRSPRLAVIQEITPLSVESRPEARALGTTTSKHRRMSTPSPEEIASIITVQAIVHASASLEQLPERRNGVVQSTILDEVPMEITLMGEVQPEVIMQKPEDVKQRDIPKKTDNRGKKKVSKPTQKKDTKLLNPHPKRVVKIDRNNTDEECMVQTKLIPELRLKFVNFSELIKEYVVEVNARSISQIEVTPVEPTFEPLLLAPPVEPLLLPPSIEPQHLAPSVELQLLPPSVEPEFLAPSVQPQQSFELPPLEPYGPPLISSTPTKGLSIQQVLSPREEVFESPRKRRRLEFRESELPQTSGLPELLTLPIESLGLSKEILTLQPVTVESELLPSTDQKRQQDIVNKIVVEGQKTLEEVCEKPINRLNIARAFNDVLVLCGRNYVTLTSEENSIELKFIDKGPKITDLY